MAHGSAAAPADGASRSHCRAAKSPGLQSCGQYSAHARLQHTRLAGRLRPDDDTLWQIHTVPADRSKRLLQPIHNLNQITIHAGNALASPQTAVGVRPETNTRAPSRRGPRAVLGRAGGRGCQRTNPGGPAPRRRAQRRKTRKGAQEVARTKLSKSRSDAPAWPAEPAMPHTHTLRAISIKALRLALHTFFHCRVCA